MKDHFSGHAAAYAAFRPTYPPELFQWLARIAPGHGRAWDCATGSGQAALALAAHFEQVVASDGSLPQLLHASGSGRVDYVAALAEQVPLADGSVDLVTVAQALHWFDLERFHQEVNRVLVPGGVLAAWCYGTLRVDPAIDPVIEHFYSETVGPWWPPERRIVEQGYRTLAFPFEEITAPVFAMEAEWGLDQLLGYLGSWSAVQHCRRETGRDPVAGLGLLLAPVWGGGRRRIAWPLALRVGRLPRN